MNASAKAFAAWVLPLYAVCSLISMAPMNLGFLLVFLTFLALEGYRHWVRLSGKAVFADILVWSWKGYLRVAAVLAFACILSLTCAGIWPYEYAGHAPEVTLHGFEKIWHLLIPVILYSVFVNAELKEHDLKRTLLFWWWATVALSVMAVIQFNTGWPLAQQIPTNPDHFHAILLFGHHLSTASIIIFPTFAAASVALGAYARANTILKKEALFAILGLLILFLSYARTAWIAVLLGAFILLVMYLPKKRAAALIGIALIALSFATQSDLLKNRIENGMGIHERIELWKANIDFFKHRPLTGIGWLKTQEMSEFYFKQLDPVNYHRYFWGHAHSNFFEMLGGTGLLGLIAFLIYSGFTLLFAYRTAAFARNRQCYYWGDFSFGILIALILLHFNGLTNVTFWEGKVMHQQMFALGLLFIVQRVVSRADCTPEH